MSFTELKLGTKLKLGFGIVLILLSIVAYVGINRIGFINSKVEQVATVRVPQLVHLYAIMEKVDATARSVRNFMLTKDETLMKGEKEKYESAKSGLFDDLEELGKMLQSEEGRKSFADLQQSMNDYVKLADKAAALGLANKNEEATLTLFEQVTPSQEKMMKLLSDFSGRQEQRAKEDVKETAQSAASGRYFLMTLGLAALVFGIAFSFLLTRSITKHLRGVIDGLSEGAEQIAAASSQVASASQQLAEGTSEQAASIEETSSSLEEMSSMTKQNAQNANQTNRLMQEARQAVGKANDLMEHVTQSMDDITSASMETQKIIKTIDEIAFQTNLLALNAAVEAARAGEAGAGFAVVADEVRNLAMRAAEAAKNTANLIEGTVKKIKDGAEMVANTNSGFQTVSDSVTKSGELVGDISAASDEQVQGIEQINKAVSEMEKVIQQNSANAEESASASEELNAQAEQMREFVASLVALVGGNGSGNIKKQSPPVVKKHIQATVSTSSSRLLSSTGQGNGKGNGTTMTVSKGSTKEVRPEQVIPFDDKGYSDF